MSADAPDTPLSLETLSLTKEKSYFTLIAVLSTLVWLIVVISIIGIFYGLLFALLGWMASGLLSAHLRAEAVRVDEKQLPALHTVFVETCAKLGLEEIPALYVIQSGGVINAFATRFSGRNFVVVYSSMLDSFGPASSEMQFILGHEIGHIRSNHILKKIFLAPGLLLPLLGPAYRRACEASCDRHGAYVAHDINGALRAMLVLSGGSGHGPKLDPAAFARQHYDERGFFVSWHELISGYPTLSARVSNLLALNNPEYAAPAPRNPLSYFFAMFNVGGGTAGGANAFVFIIIIGLLAAMAIPAFTKVRQQTALKACRNNAQVIANAYVSYAKANHKLPTSFADYVGPGQTLADLPECPDHGTYTVHLTANNTLIVECSVHGDVEFK